VALESHYRLEDLPAWHKKSLRVREALGLVPFGYAKAKQKTDIAQPYPVERHPYHIAVRKACRERDRHRAFVRNDASSSTLPTRRKTNPTMPPTDGARGLHRQPSAETPSAPSLSRGQDYTCANVLWLPNCSPGRPLPRHRKQCIQVPIKAQASWRFGGDQRLHRAASGAQWLHPCPNGRAITASLGILCVVVGASTHRIAQDFVGLLNAPKELAAPVIVIGVQLLCLATVGRSDLILGGVGVHTEEDVVTLCQVCVPSPSLKVADCEIENRVSPASMIQISTSPVKCEQKSCNSPVIQERQYLC
jgi:hypothetical protein